MQVQVEDFLPVVPAEKLSIDRARVFMAARWQIELFFKLWKGVLQMD